MKNQSRHFPNDIPSTLGNIKSDLVEKAQECTPMEFAQFDAWDIGGDPGDDIMEPDEDGHVLFSSQTWELRRSPEELRVRVFIPIDTNPHVALNLMRKLMRGVQRIADSGARDFRPDTNELPF